MSIPDQYPLGVIEGFFGRPWSWEARSHYATFLAAQGFTSYIYAPKNDASLRKRWHEPSAAAQLEALSRLCLTYQAHTLDFGIGLSPYELYLDFSTQRKQQLKRKLDEFNTVAPNTLCILFDDMTGNLEGLARKQLEIMEFVCAHSSAQHFMLCPTYYSSDPRLAKLFGSPPENYLQELGHNLDQRIGVFWTGPQIISRAYPRAHLEDIGEKLRRKPVLWDNYPVNDAQRLTNFLHLLPFTERSGELGDLCSGHLANPMNQAWLSQLPLYSLPRLYAAHPATTGQLFQQACSALCPPALAQALLEDAELFQHSGLAGINAAQNTALQQKYAALAQHPMAAEVLDWLRGGYTFDPACLT